VNFAIASPRLTIAWPGRGRTYTHWASSPGGKDLQAAETVEEDCYAAEIGVFAES